eukprot:SM000026S09007  [mRNA]  locus=s26:967427:969637:- [translate_table: standard]
MREVIPQAPARVLAVVSADAAVSRGTLRWLRHRGLRAGDALALLFVIAAIPDARAPAAQLRRAVLLARPSGFTAAPLFCCAALATPFLTPARSALAPILSGLPGGTKRPVSRCDPVQIIAHIQEVVRPLLDAYIALLHDLQAVVDFRVAKNDSEERAILDEAVAFGATKLVMGRPSKLFGRGLGNVVMYCVKNRPLGCEVLVVQKQKLVLHECGEESSPTLTTVGSGEPLLSPSSHHSQGSWGEASPRGENSKYLLKSLNVAGLPQVTTAAPRSPLGSHASSFSPPEKVKTKPTTNDDRWSFHKNPPVAAASAEVPSDNGCAEAGRRRKQGLFGWRRAPMSTASEEPKAPESPSLQSVTTTSSPTQSCSSPARWRQIVSSPRPSDSLQSVGTSDASSLRSPSSQFTLDDAICELRSLRRAPRSTLAAVAGNEDLKLDDELSRSDDGSNTGASDTVAALSLAAGGQSGLGAIDRAQRVAARRRGGHFRHMSYDATSSSANFMLVGCHTPEQEDDAMARILKSSIERRNCILLMGARQAGETPLHC